MTTKELKLDVNVEYNLVSVDTKNADKDTKYIECLIRELQDCGVTVVNHTYCNESQPTDKLFITQTLCKKPILCDRNGDILPGQMEIDIKTTNDSFTTATVKFGVIGGIYGEDKE